MRRATLAILATGCLALWAAGCNEKKSEAPVARAEQDPPPGPPYPNDQIPDAEPQPAASPNPRRVAAPVDTAVTPHEYETAQSPQTGRTTQRPKDSYAPAARKTGASYVVKKGDTLQSISKQFYSSNNQWRRIYEANRGVVKDPNKLQVGMKLQIP
jgi:nucleoid-associated protein YgaU